jgi:hypothetical protein
VTTPIRRRNSRQLPMCAVPSCPVTIGAMFLMCAPHWHRVPKELRLKVNRLFRAWLKTPDDAATLLELRQAQTEAIRLVR